jgi:Undecaprenyl-phosphate galactose phosphotransferase WbaP
MLFCDGLTLSALLAIAVTARHLITPTYSASAFFDLSPGVALMLGAFWLQGLYPGALLHPAEEMRRTFTAITLVFLVMASASFLWRNAEAYSRAVFIVSWFAAAPTVLLTRRLARVAFARKQWWGTTAMVLGTGPVAQRVVRGLQNGKRGIRVVGVLTDEPGAPWPEDLPPLLGGITLAPSLARAGAARYAIVAVPSRSNFEISRLIQDHCNGFGHVLLIPDLPGLCSLDVAAREVGGEVGFELPQRLFHQGAAFTKRLLDLSIGVLAILALLPVFLAIAAAIKLTSDGPILFGHVRKGRTGAAFTALKFRTMLPDASRILADHLDNYPEDRFEWQRDHKLKNDPRVTPVGRWLRRFSLDELPQLFNVLSGEMSLVGPRPIVEAEVARYGSGYDLYTRVRPGITGLWQVSGRNNTTYEARVAFDEYYVRNWSVWIDTYILIRTVKVVLTAEGAY